MKKRIITHARNFYARFERPISSLSLIGGFVFDAITLKRVDTLWENVWVLGHLLIVALFIILINTNENDAGDAGDPDKANFWYVNILQFFFGGLLSTYLVFYFRSSDIFVSWPFILILGLAFWANESLKRQYERLSFQISLFFLSVYSFAIFLLPVVLHSIGLSIFILSGFISLLVMWVFLYILRKWSGEKFRKNKHVIAYCIGGIYLLMNFFYFANLIPPIPLSLKDGDVYHSIVKNQNQGFLVGYEDHGWLRYFMLFERTHVVLGEPVYVYSAVFSPAQLDLNVIHEWQYFDETSHRWVSRGQVLLPVIGGREDGFRTYSKRDNLEQGDWRVNVETERGEVIGRIRFKIVPTSTPVPLVYKTI
ncbi:MAG: hypothetical protein QG589_428 [Patescibacteria group bacterium]|nr:hypothetical protein [Patescibacteria group bacterium]